MSEISSIPELMKKVADLSYISDLMQKSREAQKELATYTQDEVDAIVKVIAKTVYDNAEELARMAVEETRMGVYEDKVIKNKGKSKTIYNHIADKKTVGVINKDELTGLLKKTADVIPSITKFAFIASQSISHHLKEEK